MKIGEFVDVNFGVSGTVTAAEIVAVKEGKNGTEFDVDIVINMGTIKKERTRIHGVHQNLCILRTGESDAEPASVTDKVIEVFDSITSKMEIAEAGCEPCVRVPDSKGGYQVFICAFRCPEGTESDLALSITKTEIPSS